MVWPVVWTRFGFCRSPSSVSIASATATSSAVVANNMSPALEHSWEVAGVPMWKLIVFTLKVILSTWCFVV